MSWLEQRNGKRAPGVVQALRLCAIFALATTTAGCFQPLYGDRSVVGGSVVKEALAGVDIKQIDAPAGSSEARVAVELRNQLIFATNGNVPAAPTHRLVIRISASRTSVVVDIATARPDAEIYGLNAVYELIDLRTNQVVLKDQSFARVSYDVPGQAQRFAKQRALRDSENRAAVTLADSVRTRLASYFVAGT